MTSRTPATPTGVWLARVHTPLLALSLLGLVVGFLTAQLGTLTDTASRYHEAFVAVACASALALMGALAVRAPSRRAKLVTALTVPAGVAMGALCLNGMLAGAAQWLVGAAALAAFVVAGAAILVDLEITRDRPVSRL
jgi:FtsH-binding integral membrane protein